jgi:hypothetical protein
MNVVGPSGNAVAHAVIQEPTELLPFYVLANEFTKQIVVLHADEVTFIPNQKDPSQ